MPVKSCQFRFHPVGGELQIQHLLRHFPISDVQFLHHAEIPPQADTPIQSQQ